MKVLLVLVLIMASPILASAKNTIYKVAPVRTFDQGDGCLCSAYAVFHALEVRYLQRESELVYLDRKNLQRSTIFDRYSEQVNGYRKNAYLSNCFVEASYPHDVVRQILEYGVHPVEAPDMESISIFGDAKARHLAKVFDLPLGPEQKVIHLERELDQMIGPAGDPDFAKKVLGLDKWVGYVPTADPQRSGTWTDFVPPIMFHEELPMPQKMPKVLQETQNGIHSKIIESIKNGVPVPYCASTHCMSIDGVEVSSDGSITRFYYADSKGPRSFYWSSDTQGTSAYRGFVFLILDTEKE